jgi:hypothetical protein
VALPTRALVSAQVLLACTAATASLSAQWLHYPASGVPRTAEGKPDLRAPAPRTHDGKPDLSGMWRPANPLPCDDVSRLCGDLPITRQFLDIGTGIDGGLPYRQWVRDRINKKSPTDDPYVRCIAPGGPRMHLLPTMKQIIQTPALLVILDEYNATYRQIFTDGRPLPEDPQPAWNGYSTGHWEADTLVVNSIGYKDDQWLDGAGSALTSAAKVTERFRRPNFGRLEIEITVDDPKAYTKPWTVKIEQEAVVDTGMIDDICLENEKDLPHLK